jgi:4-hydroxythreonine-4-phosphate dehydrogenase
LLKKPKLAVTLGDPAGIGPEVVVKALAAWRHAEAAMVVLGRAGLFNSLARKLKRKIVFKDVSCFSYAGRDTSFIPCYFPKEVPEKFVYGRSDPDLTRLAVESIELAAKLAMEKTVDAVVTPPINKAGLKSAGFNIPGHTEYLAKLSGTQNYQMMLVGGPLRVVPVTRHIPLKDVSRSLSVKKIADAILLTAHELRRAFGIRRPNLVVSGLNPHAGEMGNLGDEENRVIVPAIIQARRQTSARIDGPLPPDALFFRAYRGAYDAVICMYHDQGLIPLKMIAMDSGVNVTLGLPFIRTSPDHGTGYDIAGRFKADPGSMLAALKLAVTLCKNCKKYDLAPGQN